MAEPLVYPVHSRDVWKVWPKAIWHIGRALLWDGPGAINKAEEWLSDARAQLIVYGSPRDLATGYPQTVDAAMMTQVRGRGADAHLFIWAFGANRLSEVLPFLSTVEAIAKRKGCKRVETRAVEGRRGWERILSSRGYEAIGKTAEGTTILSRKL